MAKRLGEAVKNFISQQKLRMTTRQAGRILDSHYADLDPSAGGILKIFLELRVQLAIIHFEFCNSMLAVAHSETGTFHRKVLLKDVIHKALEYGRTFSKSYARSLLQLADSRGLPGQNKRLREMLRQERKIIRFFEKFESLRNSASGHYDPDISVLVSEITQIDENEILDGIMQFLVFNGVVLRILREIGKNQEVA